MRTREVTWKINGKKRKERGGAIYWKVKRREGV